MKIVSMSKTAAKCGFKEGDAVLAMGGHSFVDALDAEYFDAQTKFEAEVKRGDKTVKVKVHKRAEESLALVFDEDLKPYRCKNKCVFCFVDQLPKGLRDTLYVKDDDYRFSFMCGSYVTMTNVSEEEIERIIRLKLSPLYVSVHAFDDDLRVKMVRNPHSKELIDVMRRLGANGIKMHTQLVIVPEMNDGEKLKESIIGLHGVEGVQTVAVVPVGLTVHRDGLDDLRAVNEAEAKATIDVVEALNADFGGGFCWCADEYYLKANREIPSCAYYGAFEQIENGVGLLADWKDNFAYGINECGKHCLNGTVCMVTGKSFAPVLETEKRLLDDELGLKVSVCAIENNFFGKSVTVAGLVTAGDIIAQTKGIKCDAFVVPNNMLREFSDTFLDDVSLAQAQKELGAPIVVVAHNGLDTAEKLVEFFEEKKKK